MKTRIIKARAILVLAFMLFSTFALTSSGQTVTTTSRTDFCTACEADCYEHSSGVKDYNMCILLCNYAANCGIPIIQ